MFICMDCDALFVVPKKYVEDHGLDSPPYEEYHGCPSCGSGCFINAIECDACGKYITDYYVETFDKNFYCADCYDVKHVADMEVRFD